MILLITYVVIALGFSFLCSVAEAVLLSVSTAYISVQKQSGKRSGVILERLYDDINRPLAAILSLNTVAHTMGAAGAGAQAAVVFGDAYLGLASAVLTLLILVFSEIIPKTLGATYWRQLAPATAYFLHYLIRVLYPFVIMSEYLTRRFKGDSPLKGMSRTEMLAMTELSKEEGQLAQEEADLLTSLLNFNELSIRDAMTHRTVVFSISEETTVETFFHKYDDKPFTRIPIYEEDDPEKVSGFVIKSDLLLAQARGNSQRQVKEYRKDMMTLLSSMPLAESMPKFLESRSHMMLVVDEYGGLEGILTLEDVLEAMLGLEIVDEKDKAVSMKKLARVMWRKREKERQNNQSNTPS
ncbi:CNNM domain-containing protein [Aestuariibacter sp. AA17]|uniref:CNNM domain-containing protein n=1 Tax=Fluctibacter corallii TaxID=2984329 RepID=A0ABT3A5N4_9ALTE|nr:CNNM domain-containing protein [Aestuariibacter sp. AA17]MCV2883998.1 CNNM domain-containing protein [Aestuariibacter sp. AA17]